jgi:F0F1-type ATP synthase assembly protein I
VQQHWKGLATYSTIGLELAGCVLLGLFAGRWLDGKLGTDWISFVGLLFGVAAGYRSVWRALKRANQEAEREAQQEQRARKDFHDRDDQH